MSSNILLKFFKVDALPLVFENDSIYITQDVGTQTATITITDSSGVPFFSVAGVSSIPVIGEVPSGSVNGSNATFTTAFDFVPSSVQVFINGLLQKHTIDYNTSGVTIISMTVSPLAGDLILVNYIKAA